MTRTHTLRWTLPGLCLSAALAMTGCQSQINGQNLPSAYVQADDAQYFPPGPEFKLSREAAAQKAYKQQMNAAEDAAAQQRQLGKSRTWPSGDLVDERASAASEYGHVH